MFFPLVVETLGLWIDSSVALLRCIAAHTTLCSVDSRGQAFQNLLQQLSIKSWSIMPTLPSLLPMVEDLRLTLSHSSFTSFCIEGPRDLLLLFTVMSSRLMIMSLLLMSWILHHLYPLMTLYSCSHNIVQSFCFFSRCWFYCYVRLSGGFQSQVYCLLQILYKLMLHFWRLSLSISPLHPMLCLICPLLFHQFPKLSVVVPCLIITTRLPDSLSHCRWGIIAVLSFIIFHWCQL